MSQPHHHQRVSDYVAALTRPHNETTTITHPDGSTETHTVTHPALIDQLATITHHNNGQGRRIPGSTLNINVDAFATLQDIDRESRAIADELLTRRGVDLTDRLRGIAGYEDLLTPDQADRIGRATRRWVHRARLVTGYDSPPMRPDVPCPNYNCERIGTLRVHIDTATAICTACGTTWTDNDPDSPELAFGRLALWIRWASEHLRGARHWLTDADGYPTECVECLTERQSMAARKIDRINAARHAENHHGAA